MATALTTCEHCNTSIKFPADKAGRTVKCPKCAEQITLPEASSPVETTPPPPSSDSPPAVQDEFRSNSASTPIVAATVDHPRSLNEQKAAAQESPPRKSRSGPDWRPDGPKINSPEPRPDPTKRCPFCAETILLAAVKCKHCGEFVDGRAPDNSLSNGLAAVLSFVVPGLGQIYKGELLQGFLILLFLGGGYWMVGILAAPFHILAVVHAFWLQPNKRP